MGTEVEEIMATLGLETDEEKSTLEAIMAELVSEGKDLQVKQKAEDPPLVEDAKADADEEEEEEAPPAEEEEEEEEGTEEKEEAETEEEEKGSGEEEEEEEQKAVPGGGLVGVIVGKLEALGSGLEGAEREALDEILKLAVSLTQVEPSAPEATKEELTGLSDRLEAMESLTARVLALEAHEGRILALEADLGVVKELAVKTEVKTEEVKTDVMAFRTFLKARPKAAVRPSQDAVVLDPKGDLAKRVEKEMKEAEGAAGPLSGFIGYRGQE